MVVHSGDIDVSPGITYTLSMEVNVSINQFTVTIVIWHGYI